MVEFARTRDWRILLKAVGGILVTLGVAGELFIEFWAHRKEGRLKIINSEIEAESESKLKFAEVRIAELNLELDRERGRRLELEQYLSRPGDSS